MSIDVVGKSTAYLMVAYSERETHPSNIYFMFGLQAPGRIRTTSPYSTLKNALQYLFLPR